MNSIHTLFLSSIVFLKFTRYCLFSFNCVFSSSISAWWRTLSYRYKKTNIVNSFRSDSIWTALFERYNRHNKKRDRPKPWGITWTHKMKNMKITPVYLPPKWVCIEMTSSSALILEVFREINIKHAGSLILYNICHFLKIIVQCCAELMKWYILGEIGSLHSQENIICNFLVGCKRLR